MITAIIETLNDEVALAHALAALVPAATEGIVREVVIIDRGSSDGTLTVADVAGCTIIETAKSIGDPRRTAAERARGDWLLFLSPKASLAPGWQSRAMAFIDRALVSGRAQSGAATFRTGEWRAGFWARLMSVVFPGEGRLIAKTAYLAATSSSRASSAISSASGAHRGAA